MVIQIILFMFLGIICGVFTGITPGIHINLISSIIANISTLAIFSQINKEPILLCVMVFSMSITHTFLDSIPSIFLGVPDGASSAISILPGHQMVLEGKGFLGLKYTLIGSFLSIFFSIICFFILLPIYLKHALIKKHIKSILILIVSFLLSKNIIRAIKTKKPVFLINIILFFFITFILGVIVLNFNLTNPLFHLFSGMFGISSILFSINFKIPKQSDQDKMKKNSFLTLIKKNYLIIFVTSLLSQIMLFLPGISSSIALIIVFLLFSESNENYLFASGASNTSAMIVSPLILYFTQIARNGTSIFIKDKLLETLNLEFVVIILITGIISSICAFFLAKKISKTVLFILSKLNYKLVNLGIFLTIITISFIFDGFYGLIFLFISAVVGYFIIKKEIPRYFGMNTILSNVLLFYFSR